MEVNVPPKVRAAVYLLSVFINAVFGVLVAQEYSVPVPVLALLAGFNAVVAILARVNVPTKKAKK